MAQGEASGAARERSAPVRASHVSSTCTESGSAGTSYPVAH